MLSLLDGNACVVYVKRQSQLVGDEAERRCVAFAPGHPGPLS
ncbi:hypothetical protein [Glaciecola sp. MH2013]|nr:hypothetical protein [Glaciecola sp. MH2013]